MSVSLLFRDRLAARSLREARIAVDERASTGGVFTTLLNPDGDGKNYRVGVWTATGALVVLAAGDAEVLVVGGGMGNFDAARLGCGGDVVRGRFTLPAGRHAVTVGAGGGQSAPITGADCGQASSIGTVVVTAVSPMAQTVPTGAGGTAASAGAGLVSTISGSSVTYARGGATPPTANRGDGGGNAAGTAGIVYVRWEI